tara:strand:+ start:174 stop:443 length:270 start_codon:yes stop_codon:yes gene_type:complete
MINPVNILEGRTYMCDFSTVTVLDKKGKPAPGTKSLSHRKQYDSHGIIIHNHRRDETLVVEDCQSPFYHFTIPYTSVSNIIEEPYYEGM